MSSLVENENMAQPRATDRKLPAISSRKATGNTLDEHGAAEVPVDPGATIPRRSLDASVDGMLPYQEAESQTCAEYIAQNCKASILRVFPGQFLNTPVEDMLKAARAGDAAARTAKKLLFESRFQK
jgi:hypothetical protein